MRVRLLVLSVLWTTWALATAALVEQVSVDAVNYHAGKTSIGVNDSCELPGQDSSYGNAAWRWWPPGEVCVDLNGNEFRSPPGWRSGAFIVAFVGLLTLPYMTFGLASADRRRHARDADPGATLDELSWSRE